MYKILFVCRSFVANNKDGGIYFVNRNLSFMKKLFGDSNVDIFEIRSPSKLQRIKNLIFMESYGHTHSMKMSLLNKLKNKYLFIYFDRSLYGGYVKLCAKAGLRSLVFYQNVEYHFFLDKYKVSKNIIDCMAVPYVYHNEKLSTKYGTKLVTLSSRDDNELRHYYKKGADLILPTSFGMNDEPRAINSLVKTRYCLFVGSKLYANVQGMKWFIENVAPYCHYEFWIAGDVCDSLNNSNYFQNNIKIKGYVENLADLYVNAEAIISPIFYGSGLKN